MVGILIIIAMVAVIPVAIIIIAIISRNNEKKSKAKIADENRTKLKVGDDFSVDTPVQVTNKENNHAIYKLYMFHENERKWTCRICETENPVEKSNCTVCGAGK